MKKLLCVLLMIMMVSFAGCTPKESAVEIYNKAYEQSKGYDSLTVAVDMSMDMEMSGINLEIPFKVYAEETDMQTGKNPQLYMTMNMSMFGEETAAEMWVKDGTEYTIMNGVKSTGPYDSSTSTENYEFNIGEYIKSGTVTEDGTNKVLTLVVDEDSYDEIVKEMFSNTLSTMGNMGMTSDDLDISIQEITAVVDEDYNFVSMEMIVDLDMNVSGSTAKATLNMTVDYSDINKTTIDFPDFSDFDKTALSDTGYEGFDGEGRVCTVDVSEDDLEATMDIVLYADDNNIVQGMQMLLNIDVSEFDAATQSMLKSTLDERFANEYSGEGVYVSSTLENDVYQLKVDFSDMSTAGQVVGSPTSFENTSIDYMISEFEAQGATCK